MNKGFTPLDKSRPKATEVALCQRQRGRCLTGFTLIELTVATGIFVVLVVVFIGIFSRFVSLQSEAAQTQTVLEQLRVALEVMNREIRTGFGSTYDISDGQGRGVLFRNQDGLCVHYRWSENRLQRSEVERSGTSCSPTDFSSAQYAPLTSSDVQITFLRFDVTPSEEGVGGLQNQGTVTVILQAESAKAAIAPVYLQSTVASRQVIPYAQ